MKITALLVFIAGFACVAAAEEEAKPNYRLNSATKAPPLPPATRGMLYRSVDANGKVVYSDRPKEAGEKGTKATQGNVASPEARRQTNIQLQDRKREEYEERVAAARRHAEVQRREREEAARKQKEHEAQNPGDAPRQIRIVR